MDKEKYIWENDRFRKDPYQVPDGYFAGFTERMMERVKQEPVIMTVERRRLIRPWMAWISGVAAVLLLGWFGLRTFYFKPMQEVRLQESIALFVDFYGQELHEGDLAGYIEDNKIDVLNKTSTEIDEMIQIEPDQAEEYIMESIGF